MAALDDARDLADAIAETANRAGLPTVALVTDMNQVLGRTAGNALEVREAIGFLTGTARDRRLQEVTLALAGEMLALGRLADDAETGRRMAEAALADGRAAERFAAMVADLGGPTDLLERPDHHLPRAAVVRPVPPARPGIVAAVDTRTLGLAVIELGGGRRRAADPIDHAVGLDAVAGIGEPVDADRPIAVVHARSDADAERAAEVVRRAVAIGHDPVAAGPAVIERRTGEAR
jgi:thymidine phosphorylase